MFKILVAILTASLLLVACGKDSPEQQVRMFVNTVEEVIEARDASDLKNLMSEQYLDQHLRTRSDIGVLALRYFYVNKNIHLLTRIDELDFPDPDKAQLAVYVAMTGQNVSDLDSLLNTKADLYRVDVELVREGDEWKLLRADWRPARGEDLF